VKLHTLEVQDFRGIREATVTFGPGLTVLHGPNELGKSTLVEAIRAALFQQTSSTAGDEHVTWGNSRPACVALTFEHSEKLWRVEKRFGFRRLAKLLCSDSLEAPRYRDIAEGNHAEGRLRDLLAWGIAPPGGRGAGPKLESYLLTALVGRQGEVQGIFDASLDRDRDVTGKALVTRALGALDKDPVVTGIVDKLTKRVDQAFTSKDRRPKTSADSPLFVLQQALRKQEDVLNALREADGQGQDVRRNVVRLQDDRQRLLGEVDAADTAVQGARAQAERVGARALLEGEIDVLRQQRGQLEQQLAELRLLEGQLASIEARLVAANTVAHAAAHALEASRQQVQASGEAVARATEVVAQAGNVADEARARRRAELDAQRTTVEARLRDVAAAEQAMAEATDLQRESADASAALDAKAAAVGHAERVAAHATVRAQLDVLNERQQVVARAGADLGDAQQRERAAGERLDAAKAGLLLAERRRDGQASEPDANAIKTAEAELTLLRAVESHIGLASMRTEVQSLEEAAERARAQRKEALARRSQASDIEQRVASRVLPTPERVAAWRALEREIAASPASASTAPTAPAVPVAAGLIGGLAVAAGGYLALGWPMPAAAIAGLVVAAIVGAMVWVPMRSRSRAQDVERQQFVRRRDRWVQEVESSLRSAGLTNLAAFEGAVAEIDGLRADAQRLRADADRHDAAAVDTERTAAPLDARREALTRLERDMPIADAAVLSARMAQFGTDAGAVQRRVAQVEQDLEATRAHVRDAAVEAVRVAVADRDARQAAYDLAAREAASAETALRLAREQSDPDALDTLLARLEELGGGATPAGSVSDAATALDEAKQQLATAVAQADGLLARLEAARTVADQRLTGLGASPGEMRLQIEQSLHAFAEELASLETSPADGAAAAAAALQQARNEHARLERLLDDQQAALGAETTQRAETEAAAMALRTDIASRRGQLNAVDRVALDARLQQASSDPVFATSDEAPLDPDAAQSTLERLQRQLERCTADLNQATGQLTLIAGHVGSERLAQQDDAVSYARAEVLERELDEKAALRLLREIEAVEATRATHLGRALAGPVTRAFRTLTGDRYEQIAFTPDLRTEHVEADGQPRKLECLSVGTREQLATLLRLAIAGHLQTAVVLDDQLVHSDSARLAWFGERLRASALDHGHQVIVFTCRPGDYIPTDATIDGASVALVELAQQVHR